MTGWQGNEGGWNPQPDPYGGQYGGGQQYGGQGQYGGYGADPYSGQYGADPYGANPYGAGGTSAYPAYQGSGFGPPPEPPKRSKLPIVLSIVAILAVVGTVVTIVLINREQDPAASPTAGQQTSSSRPPSSSRSPSSSRRLPPSTSRAPGGGPKEGWTTIAFTGGTYQVPGDWQKTSAARTSGLGVDFAGGAEAGNYDCGGTNGYSRGFTATGEVQSADGTELDVQEVVADFAASFAKGYYNNATVEPPTPEATEVDGHDAAITTAKLTNTPAKPECEATSGEAAVVGVVIEKDGKATGVRMLVVVNDLAGGPATPPALPDALAEEILGTLTVE